MPWISLVFLAIAGVGIFAGRAFLTADNKIIGIPVTCVGGAFGLMALVTWLRLG